MAIELFVYGQKLELLSDTKIKYTKQVSDIFNIAKVKASYTNSFSLPKTPNNTRVFGGLGLVGSTSNTPYQKTAVTLKDNGVDLIQNGWLDVKETSDFYKINIIDGAIDFFKQIENTTLGEIDLSKLDHQKNVNTIRNSHVNSNVKEFYRYILADYGGRKTGVATEFYAEYLIPSARYKYIVEQIFKHFGWSVSGSVFNNNTYKNSWITYPKEIEENPDDFQLVGTFRNVNYTLYPGEYKITKWNTKNIPTYGNVQFLEENNGKIKVKETNVYKVFVRASGRAYYKLGGSGGFYLRNSFAVNQPLDVYINSNETTYKGNIHPSKEIEFFVDPAPFFPDYSTKIDHITLTEVFVVIHKNVSPEVSFTQEFKNIRITDFFNDFLRRFAQTPIFDNYSKTIRFYWIDEMLNTQNAKDWSDKYVSRDKETYLYGAYAQQNYFRHKYNQEGEDFADGVLSVDNKNLPAEKTLFQSFFYNYDRISTKILNKWTPIYPIWQKEVSETANNQVKISYKSLENRFYFVKTQKGTNPGGSQLIIIKKEQQDNSGNPTASSISISQASVISDEFTTFNEYLNDYYAKYKAILNKCKVHTFTMALSTADIVNLDFTKPIYIQQEASYYLLNKVEYQNGELAKVEAVRIEN